MQESYCATMYKNNINSTRSVKKDVKIDIVQNKFYVFICILYIFLCNKCPLSAKGGIIEGILQRGEKISHSGSYYNRVG